MISPRDLMTQLGGERAPLVVDVRGDDEYAAGHVPGALHIPLAELESRLGALPADRPIVTYCMMRHRGESRGERAADLLRSKGYAVQVLDGGLPAWQQADADVLTASAPGAIQHMNADHRQSLLDFARGLAGLAWAEDAEMIALDRYGFGLRVTGPDQEQTVRIPFDPPLTEPGQLRPAIVKLAQLARQRLQMLNDQ